MQHPDARNNSVVSANKRYASGLMWFRRDLRNTDNAALFYALKHCQKVYAVFVFDTAILQSLPAYDRRVAFIWHCLQELNAALRQQGGQLIVLHDSAESAIPRIAQELGVQAVFTNHDYEPQAIKRDTHVAHALDAHHIALYTFKDHVVFERDEVVKKDGNPYTVYTPYWKRWQAQLHPFFVTAYPVSRYAHRLAQPPQFLNHPMPSLSAIGFEETDIQSLLDNTGGCGMTGAQCAWNDFQNRITHYHNKRDFPAVKGVSYLSVHLRFGTLSIRQIAGYAAQHMQQGNADAATWLKELAWRDFYAQILFHFPHVEGGSFKPAYNSIQWYDGEHANTWFAAWCEGRTGYPLVDAAMRQLNQTGYMHNRLRMVVASFLTKDLGLNWRKGEAYFAEKLNDFDLAANNGGWQWAASTGCDAQPYFRIFNPVSQSKKFDKEGMFIRKYVPEIASLDNKSIHTPWEAKPLDLQAANIKLGDQQDETADYPLPIVDHATARAETLERYQIVKSQISVT